MQSIITRYLPATNTKGTRIKAFSSYGKDSVTVPYDYTGDANHNHLMAAQKLAIKLKWNGMWVQGPLPGRDMVHVNTDADEIKCLPCSKASALIIVEGGLVQEVAAIGCTVTIRDYDVEGTSCPEDIQKDSNGNEYLEQIHEGKTL